MRVIQQLSDEEISGWLVDIQKMLTKALNAARWKATKSFQSWIVDQEKAHSKGLFKYIAQDIGSPIDPLKSVFVSGEVVTDPLIVAETKAIPWTTLWQRDCAKRNDVLETLKGIRTLAKGMKFRRSPFIPLMVPCPLFPMELPLGWTR